MQSRPHIFCEESLGKIKFRAFPKRVGLRILSLESVDNTLEQVRGDGGGGGHDLAKFRIPMIHRFMKSHPVAGLLLCFGAKHQNGRPMPFGFFVILTHRLTELCIMNAENVEKVYSRSFKQMS